MTPLDRLLELVHRTQLPTLIQPSESGEPCVVLPLGVYEQLVKGKTVSTDQQPKERLDQAEVPPSTLVEIPLTFSELPQPVEQPKGGIRLQDLLHTQAPAGSITPMLSTRPQIETLEDRFVFDGYDAKILPQIKQKKGFEDGVSDPFGPTLA